MQTNIGKLTPHKFSSKKMFRSACKCLFLLSSVISQSIPEQQNSPQACVAGTPDSIGLVGAFNEGSVPDSCVEICREKGYDLAFITGARLSKCYCGDSVPMQVDSPALVICQTPCTDGIQLGCGSDGLYNGLPAFAVYLVRSFPKCRLMAKQ